MLFDWFTFGAQTLNFLVLVWLMKRFLYQPILSAIDAREKRIAQTLADAALKQIAAQKERETFQKKNKDLEDQRSALLAQAEADALAERLRLQSEAQQAADTLRNKKHDALASELQTLQQDMGRRSREEVFAIARKVLADLADTTLEERMGMVFTQRLRALDDNAKAGLVKALKTASTPVQVRSAFELTANQQAEIQNALNDTLSGEVQIQFDTTPEVISGIELTANGWKLAWHTADLLASLEQRVGKLVKAQADGQMQAKASEEVA